MRVFVAVDVSGADVIESIARFQSQAGIKAKPVDLHSLHFTLQFLGEVSQDMVEKIKQALNTVEFSSFMLSYRGVGVFPSPKFPKVVWIGTDANASKELNALAREIKRVLMPLGFSSDRQFKPHVTVFRIKRPADVTDMLKMFGTAEFGRQKVSSAKLKQSILTADGPTYLDLAEVRMP